MRCALVVGHKSSSPGAVNPARNLSEFEFNARLAIDIWKRLSTSDVEVVLVWRRTYSALPYEINEIDPVLVVSMHANAFDRTVSGSETLYYHRSRMSKKTAEVFQRHFVAGLGLADRGAKPVTREDRGGELLANVDAPAVICEPFFIDNDADLELAISVDLASIYADAIKEGVRLN